jgi:hypothetical protein
MVRLRGTSSCTIPVSLDVVWAEVQNLEWLVAPDAVRLDGPVQAGSVFALLFENRTIAGRFTVVEAPTRLEWEAENGSAGSVTLARCAEGTQVDCVLVDVPTAAVDKVAAGALSLVARKKVQRLTNEDAAKDLHALTVHAKRRAAGEPVRICNAQMLGVTDLGSGSWEPETVPAFDDEGGLVLLPGEEIVRQDRAAKLGAETAEAAGGREQFRALWPLQSDVAITLTSERLVYQLTDLGKGDWTWLAVGGVTGLALTATSYARAAHRKRGKAVAGHVMHRYVANILRGDGSRMSAPELVRATATLLSPPKSIIRVHLLRHADDGLTDAWVRAVAKERLRDKPSASDEKWEQLRSQFQNPEPKDGYWGLMHVLPHYCALGAARPAAPVLSN